MDNRVYSLRQETWLEIRPSVGHWHRSRFLISGARGMYEVSDEIQFVVEIDKSRQMVFGESYDKRKGSSEQVKMSFVFTSCLFV